MSTVFKRIVLYFTSTMTTSSEDVLMQVSQVRYKKGDGTLYVMNERIAWMLDNRDTVSVSHKYADIKCKILKSCVNIIDVIGLINLLAYICIYALYLSYYCQSL